MSEKAPKNPEKQPKPLLDDCMNCEEEIALDRSNTFILMYEVDQSCNHLYVGCPCCGEPYRVFCNSETIDRAIEAGVLVNPIVNIRDYHTGEIIKSERAGGRYAPEEVWAMRYELDGFEPVQPVEISPRHEDQIRAFGETLCAMTERDPDGFWAEMELPQDRPYPGKWC